MSADSLNAAPPPANATEARSSSASAAGPKHREHKGPAVGFEALLAVLTAAQDQTAAATPDAAAKLALQGLPVQVGAEAGDAAKAASEKDASAQDGSTDSAKDGAASGLDAALAAQNTVAVAPVVVPATPIICVSVPTPTPADADTTAPTLAAKTAAGPAPAKVDLALKSLPAGDDDQAEAAEDLPAEHDPKAYGLSKLESGRTIPADAAATRRIERAEVKAALTPPPVATPTAAPAAAPTAETPEPQTPAATAATATATATAPVLAEAGAQAAATPPAPKDKGASRYARGEDERSRATPATTAGASAAGSAISARMADVAKSANDAQAQTFALAPASGGDAQDLAPALAANAEAPEAAAPGADLNTATSNTTAPATVTQAAAHQVRGQPQTVANLAAQIVKKLDGRSTRFDVALDPVGLGHVDVRVMIGAQGRMTAALAFDTPQAAAELRARSNELQTALEQAGFDISGGLSFDVATDGGQSQGSAGQDNQPAPVFRGRAFQTALDTVVEPAANRPFQNRRSSASGVDIRI